MLRPLARSFRRSAIARCQCCSLSRRIHISPVRAIDDPDNRNTSTDSKTSCSHGQPSAQDDTQTSKSPSEKSSTDEMPLEARAMNAISSNQELSRSNHKKDTQIQRHRPKRNTQVDSLPSTTPTDNAQNKYTGMSEKDFAVRQQEREARLQEDRERFRLPVESFAERQRQFREALHRERQKTNDEAAIRGAQVFEMVNKARSERGETPIGYRRRGEVEGDKERSNNRSSSSLGLSRRPSGRNREHTDRDHAHSSRRTGVPALDARTQFFLSEQEPDTHSYSPSFNPSMSIIQGHDEVDIELGYDFPDPIGKKSTYTVANRDGTITEGRKTNKDHDQMPDDAQEYVDIYDLGPMSGRNFYSPKVDMTDDTAQIRSRIQKTNYSETNVDDVKELFQIKKDIEDGLSGSERLAARRDREGEKAVGKRLEEMLEGTNQGLWSQQVPLPQPHKPETADLDDYVPPMITHTDFRRNIPAIPVGVQGRLRAVHEVAINPHPSKIPPGLHDFEAGSGVSSMTEEERGEFKKSLDEAIKLLSESEFEPLDRGVPKYMPKLDRRHKKVKGPPLRYIKARPGPTYNPDRQMDFTDIYSDTQLAIWREMHKDSFAPLNSKYPMFGDDDETITPEMERKEGVEREDAHQIMKRLDAATLRNFRRRDEWEIRDIRRRLGLPIVNHTYMPEAYVDKNTLDAPSPWDIVPENIEPKQDHVLHGEITDAKPEPESDNIQSHLSFWREAKAYLTTLSTRINQLRTITHETSDRMRRHGTIEVLKRASVNAQSTDVEIVRETENGIVAELHAKFMDVHKKLENLEIIVTAVLVGHRGPQDREYSDAWIEHNLHEDLKKEFEMTARRMGFPPNSVPMEPQITEEQEQELAALRDNWLDMAARIGVGGEYRESGVYPQTESEFPLGVAAQYAGKSGMSVLDKEWKLSLMRYTLGQSGLLKTPKFADEDGKATDEQANAAGEHEDQGSTIGDSHEVGMSMSSEWVEPLMTETLEGIPSGQLKIMEQLRRSMAEMDKEVSSLEESYDAFLERQPLVTPTPPTPNPSQETST